MDNSFKKLLDFSSFVILLPTRPFFDQVAAGLALYLALKEEKQVGIACPSPMIVEFNRLVGVDKVVTEVGNKNLVIRFSDYKAGDIERVSYDIEDGEFRLSVIPKTGLLPPQKDQVEFSYSGLSADVIILIGGTNEGHFPALMNKDLVGTQLAHIGQRDVVLDKEKKYMSFARPASSCSEVAAELIKETGLPLDVDTASNLLMGIEVGSNKFFGEGVSADTFQTVADLMRIGGERFKVKKEPTEAVAETKLPKQEDAGPPKDWLGPKIYKGTTVS